MFSVVLPSRPCLTDVVPLSSDPTVPANNFAFTFPALPKFSHIVIFLLPGVVLPPDTAAAVYIQFPKDLILNPTNTTTATSAAPEFKFLGAIANEKPSAIFRVSFPSARRRTEAEEEDEMMDEGATVPANPAEINPNATITLGITIEPVQAVASKMTDLQNQGQNQLQRSSFPSSVDLVKMSAGQQGAGVVTKWSSAPSTKTLAQRIIGNAFNYLASFAATDPRAPGEEVVPLRVFRDWWTKFESRIDSDPGFLERPDTV
ncbi:hypothetical protein RJZ56_005413 [Blastomyces dermatitidis]|uniref:DUF775 domain-containing protein n=3 Tax=Blastomyces TaxID=229219 RepID=A0A179UVN1_BLAGS|nr:DUF775 domain-containing protein [Blastomyces gilchristii SLH14081]XP_045274633.1 uncharacterized protein BDCG_02399 [Blastomyces dermatitidis ER-3]EGE85680.1 DUF775 domain-containing protein [Blastomyces dermatitidis ATCC 18188]EQL33175.1 hypothetical protein BDFG_04775 [Blastomyces dermatitidis ATCC 26199]EEQ87279.1 hypothetical protein BDCG_02399 [Blastomyces dermatitidis ER-3]OAT11289.1 DUF775 domain-containing protein [Blastomyces gilchristii SLH14081]